MTRYILIDINSGFVWGDVSAESPVAAARAVDENLRVIGRTYTERGAGAQVAESHYIVHVAASDTPEITDGQDAAQIAIVEALPRVACVVYSNA